MDRTKGAQIAAQMPFVRLALGDRLKVKVIPRFSCETLTEGRRRFFGPLDLEPEAMGLVPVPLSPPPAAWIRLHEVGKRDVHTDWKGPQASKNVCGPR